MQLLLLYIQIIPIFVVGNKQLLKYEVMKTKSLLFVFSLIGVATFSSCEKNLYDESKQPEKEKQVTDLNIPADFAWKLSKNTQCFVTSNAATDVEIFTDESCAENTKLATITTVGEDIPLPLSIPTYVKTLYLKYNNGKTTSSSINEDGNFLFTITDAQANVMSRSATTRDNDNYKPEGGIIYYPSNGWGTIMFEDEFPSLGDYDFNDFVVNYKVQLQGLNTEKHKEYTAEVIQIGLQLRAIGGILPYFPYLRLNQLDKASIDEVNIENYSNIADNISIPITADKEGKAIINFSALKQFANPNVNSIYFNTTEDNRIAEKDLPSLNITIYLNTPVLVDELLDDSNFDFFLANKEGKEIHMNGFSPIYFEYPFGNNDLRPISGNNDNYYFSTNGLIWGFKIPDVTPHAIERANFLEAYKNFGKWAESNGQNSQNWYGQGNRNDDLLVK